MNRKETPTSNIPILRVESFDEQAKQLWIGFGMDGIRKPFEGIFCVAFSSDDALTLQKYHTEMPTIQLCFINIYGSVARPIYKNATETAVPSDLMAGGRFLFTFDTDERKLYMI